MDRGNCMFKFVQLLIARGKKNRKEANWTEKQEKAFVYDILMRHFEKTEWKKDEIFHIYEKTYSGFSSDEFFQYVIEHTTNSGILFEEKLKVEARMQEISEEISKIDEGIEEKEKGIHKHIELLDKRLDEIKKKYKIPFEKISGSANEKEEMEYLEILQDLINNSSSVEEVYEMLRGNITQFSGMGYKIPLFLKAYYPQLNRQLYEYIELLVNRESKPILEERKRNEGEIEKIKNAKKELEEEFARLDQIYKKYDERLPAKLQGTQEDRRKFKLERKREGYGRPYNTEREVLELDL